MLSHTWKFEKTKSGITIECVKCGFKPEIGIQCYSENRDNYPIYQIGSNKPLMINSSNDTKFTLSGHFNIPCPIKSCEEIIMEKALK